MKRKEIDRKLYEIRLRKPASAWDDGLPLGNGRLGAMVMGKADEETIYINEESIWYGADRDRKNQDTLKYLPEVRRLLLNGEIQKAQFLARMSMTSTPKYVNPYQPAGNMRICFYDHKYPVMDYSRRLNLNDAICRVQYRMKNVLYTREHLVSHAYQVFAMKLQAAEKITFSVTMCRKPFDEHSQKLDDCTVCSYGGLGENGLHYFTGIRLACKGGTVHTIGDFVYVNGADEAYIYLACGTDFQDSEYRQNIMKRLDAAEKAGYEEIQRKHLLEHHALFDRMELSFGGMDDPECSTDELLEQATSDENKTVYLSELLFHYARYLMISCSHDCLLPANLQGIWNGDYVPAWLSEFTININTEMNYWMVEKCNLSECHLPLFEQMKRMLPKGKETAKILYDCEGFCAHHNTNIWGNTDPEGILDASPIWVMGGAWLSLHLYEHYAYTRDMEFLRNEALPIMREAIRFFEDYLYQTEEGLLITGPTISPENSYISKLGAEGALCMGASMDSEILRQLFSDYLEGCAVLEADEASAPLLAACDIVRKMLSSLPPISLTADGRIREWMEDYEEVEPGHRHISHLFALHPGRQISEHDESLFMAARKTLQYRLANGGGHTGWSCAWIACFWARLKDKEQVWMTIRKMLEKCIKINLLDTHPPFQIDGNFGIAECMVEMLVQDHTGKIIFLPALPSALARDGFVKGMVLRGGIEADFSWKMGSLTKVCLTAKKTMSITICIEDKEHHVELIAGREKQII